MTQQVEAVLEELKGRGHRMTPQRRAIVAEVLGSHGHISPQQIAGGLAETVPGMNVSTVYRTLELLEELGVVSHTHLGSGAEYHLADDRDHAHLVCASCHRWFSETVDKLGDVSEALRDATGFTPDLTHYAISGLCRQCATKS
jgi:Fur family ferric uptake transcriptional regulator